MDKILGEFDSMLTVILLILSNVFMTFAWYGHLDFKQSAYWKVILASWGIAFFEYCLQVPANRIGSNTFSTFQLKIIQEIVSILVFVGFIVLYRHEKFQWNYLISFGLIVGAVYFAFLPGKAA